VSGWLFKKKSITMHGNTNVKFMFRISLHSLYSTFSTKRFEFFFSTLTWRCQLHPKKWIGNSI